jgi:hypothetical protein
VTTMIPPTRGPSGRMPWLLWVGALAGFALCMALAVRRHLLLTS